MVEQISLDMLKKFIKEKPWLVIVAIIVTLLIYIFIPEECFVYQKLGRNLFLLFVFFVSFIVLVAIRHLIEIIISVINEQISASLSDKENFRKLWDYIDSLSTSDKELVKEFLKNGNKPYIISERGVSGLDYENPNSLLLNYKLVKRTECTSTAVDKEKYFYDSFTLICLEKFHYNEKLYMYKLSDDFFLRLKKSQENYGKISYFEEDKNNE